MKTKILFFLCLIATACSAKKDGRESVVSSVSDSTLQTSSAQNNGREEVFIREFYAKYLVAENLWFENDIPRDSIECTKDTFLNNNCTRNFFKYYEVYYTTDENGEFVNGDCGCIFTSVQDDEGLQPNDMAIEKKEQNWYTATYVWWLGDSINGISCSRLKVVPTGNSFKVDSIMLGIYMEHERDSVYEAQSLDRRPAFVGGEKRLREYLKAHGLTCKWDIAKGSKGDYTVEFIVGKDGWTRECWQFKNVDDEYEKEIYYLLTNMPRWQPGVKDGENVASAVSLTLKKVSK